MMHIQDRCIKRAIFFSIFGIFCFSGKIFNDTERSLEIKSSFALFQNSRNFCPLVIKYSSQPMLSPAHKGPCISYFIGV